MPERTDLLRSTLRSCAGGVAFAAFVGLFVNILYLVPPLFSIQVFDRVMSSRSLDTLVMLGIITAVGLLFLAILDYVRARVFMIVGERLIRRLSTATFEAAVSESLRSQSAIAGNAMRDLQELRQFVSGGPIALPIDAAFAPIFLAALILLHPAYALVAVIGTVLMLGMGLLMELLVRRPMEAANDAALKSHAEVGAAIRNAELIEAMGMRTSIVRRWRAGQNRVLSLVGIGNQGARAIGAASRSMRMGLQAAMIATGAALVVEHAATSRWRRATAGCRWTGSPSFPPAATGRC